MYDGFINQSKLQKYVWGIVKVDEWNAFCHKLECQENIYDLLVLLYSQIEGQNKPQYFREYYEKQNEVAEGYWSDLSLITNEFLRNKISFQYYVDKFKDCVNEDNMRNVAIRMLIDFDIFLAERKRYPALELERASFSGNVYSFGPFNKTDSEYGLYLMPNYHYFNNINAKSQSNIRFMDKSGFTRIDNRIKHYKIIKKSELGKRIEIKYYDGIKSIKETYPKLKIAIVPVAKKLWCKVVYKEYEKSDMRYFSLEDMAEYSEERNEAYIKVLQKCMDSNIQIVIFPELARNKATLEEIRKFLSWKALEQPNSLELIFMGSLWEDGKNEGILISGTGTILMRSQKINKFSLKKKGKEYWEDLKEEA